MVETAIRVCRGLEAGGFQQVAHAPGEAGMPGRGPLYSVCLRRKPVVVVQHRRLRSGHHGRYRFLPMRGYDEDGVRRILRNIANRTKICGKLIELSPAAKANIDKR